MVVAALVLATASLSPAATVTVTPSRDNTLYETSDGSLSNGAGQNLFAGRTAQDPGQSIRRGLIRFDVASAIPLGSKITNVTLTLHLSMAISSGDSVSLHRLSTDWGESTSNADSMPGIGAPSQPGDATWLHTFFPSSFWNTPGGDFLATVSATTVVGQTNGFYTWAITRQAVADVQDWLDHPSTHFGWLIQGEESTGRTAKKFDSRENLNPALRPMLSIDYLPPGDTNCDGVVNEADVALFVQALINPAGYVGCDITRADANADGLIDGRDVQAFVKAMF